MSAIQYQFTILRYTPNLAREEFVNIGIVMFLPVTGKLQHRTLAPGCNLLPPIPNRPEKEIRQFLRGIHHYFAATLEDIDDICLDRHDLYPGALGFDPILEILKREDASLSWSPMKCGIHFDPFERLGSLFEELVRPQPLFFESNLLETEP